MSAGMMPPDADMDPRMDPSGEAGMDPQADANGGATAPDPMAMLQQLLQGGGTFVPPVQQEDLNEVLNELLGAARMCASKARSAQDPREDRELGQAALAFAQAWTIMHPSILAPQGVGPEVAAAAIPQQPQGGTTGRPPQPTARRSSGQVKG